MKVLIVLVALVASLNSNAAPSLDPNKYTVCAMTMNSTNERAVFERQVQKQSNKFNPIVELTSFGKEDWFEKACASGIKCDQVIVSGHFAAGFSGSLTGNSSQKLPLKKMEKAGCMNTCDGILDHPYEVFLFGCNTLATKATDRRGPEKYLDVLVNEDHVPLVTASFVVESRYGRTGDDNKTRIERSFRGETKQIYGFTSVGPSGKSVERLLNDYFSRNTLESGLNKAQAARFTRKLNYVNNELAKSLSITDFGQCTGGSDDPKDRRICTILNDSFSVDKRIDAIYGALQSDEWLKYIPTINDFFKKYPPKSMTASQKQELEALIQNKVIKSQVKGLVKSTKNIVVMVEWLKFGQHFKYLTKDEESQAITSNINRMINEGMSAQEVKFICGNKSLIGPRFEGDRPSALSCLSSPGRSKREPLTRESLGLDKL